MMLHQDASTHAWLLGDEHHYDLVATMDDATSEVYSLFLVEQEGTGLQPAGGREVIEAHGLFCSLYTDRGRHSFETAAAGARVSKTVLTQFGRANSPMAWPLYRSACDASSPRTMFGVCL